MKKYILLVLISVLATTSVQAQSYEELIKSGMDYAEKEDYMAAAAYFKSAMRKEPGNSGNIMVSINLAAMLRHLKEYDEALILYNSAIANNQNNAFFLHNRASLYCELSKFDDAKRDYNAIILNNNDDQEALYRRGLIYMEQKNLFAAEDDFDKILSIDKKNVRAKMGKALIMKYREDWDDAEKLYSDLLFDYRNSPDLYFQRAECYLNMKKFARTQDDINKAINLGYKDYPIYILQGRLFLAQYDKRLAKSSFDKARELGASEELINGYMYAGLTEKKEDKKSKKSDNE